MKYKIFFIILIILFINNGIFSQVDSQKEPPRIPKIQLRGLDLNKISLFCMVSSEEFGITTEMLTAYIVTELKKRGIIISKEHIIDIDRNFVEYKKRGKWISRKNIYPTLMVKLWSSQEPCLNNFIALIDKVYLERDPSISFRVDIWRWNSPDLVSGKNIVKQILTFYSFGLDEFIKDYNLAQKRK